MAISVLAKAFTYQWFQTKIEETRQRSSAGGSSQSNVSRSTNMIISAKQRLLSKAVCGVHKNSCWDWTGSLSYKGYGQIWDRDKQRPNAAHRMSFEIFKGSIDDGLFVCHKCDNPGCINPKHLFLGTPKDNTQDMLSKGREASGERSGASKLSDAEIIKLRSMYGKGFSVQKLMKVFGLTGGHVREIVIGKKRKKSGGPIQKELRTAMSFLSDEIVLAIFEDPLTTLSMNQLAKRFGVSLSTVKGIRSKNTYSRVTNRRSP